MPLIHRGRVFVWRPQTASRASSEISPAEDDISIYLFRNPVDFRVGINGPAMVVEATFKYDPFSRKKRRTQIKGL
jgi:hypothetical protein